MVAYEPRNWLEILVKTQGSVLPRLAFRLLAIAATGGLALYIYHFHQFKLAPVVHTMVGVALGLLLVFRTNTSYDRYWEGRKLLGALVNRVRDLVRQCGSPPGGQELTVEVQRRLAIACALIRKRLRDERDLGDLPLTAEERAALEPVKARHLVYLGWLSQLLSDAHRRGILSDPAYRLADANISGIIDVIGGCERILLTPVPFAYAQHIKGFLFLFCFSVPFVLVDPCGAYTPLAAAAIGYALFGIEEIGVEIEDPFGTDPNDLPLDAIEQGIIAATSELVQCRATSPYPPAA